MEYQIIQAVQSPLIPHKNGMDKRRASIDNLRLLKFWAATAAPDRDPWLWVEGRIGSTNCDFYADNGIHLFQA